MLTHTCKNNTIEIAIPPYGNINRIRIMMHLEGGIGEASFQPAGYSRPYSECRGTTFTPAPNKQTRITYIDYAGALSTKAVWGTFEIKRAVVTYQLCAKVIKTTGYVVEKEKI